LVSLNKYDHLRSINQTSYHPLQREQYLDCLDQEQFG